MEYEYASAHGLNVLVFLLADDALWKHQYDEREKDPRVNDWRKQLAKDHTVKWFNHEPTSVEVLPAVTSWLTERKHPLERLWPTLADIELVTQSFFESSFPAYVLDPSQRVVAWNTSFRVLVGQNDGPKRGQRLNDWLESKGHHEVTMARSAQQWAPSIERGVLVLNTESFGRTQFDQLSTPVIERESGETRYRTAALSPSGTDPERIAGFLTAVEKRLAKQLFWTQYAVAYDKVLLPYSGYQELIRLHCECVRSAPTGHVLDLGAGTGNIALAILKQYAGRTVYAIDNNQSMLYQLASKCRRYEDRLVIQFDDVENFSDVMPDAFAAVVMNNVLMFLKDPQSVLRRVSTSLIDNGLLSIHVPNQTSSIENLLLNVERELGRSGRLIKLRKEFDLVASHNRSMDAGSEKLWRFSTDDLYHLLDEAGFVVDCLPQPTYAEQGIYISARKKATA
jgi:trans-aconitate methyltransferase